MARPRPVKTKSDFVRRYAAGEFGNASPTWPGLSDWVGEGCPFYDGFFHLRNRRASGETRYGVPGKELGKRWGEVVSKSGSDGLYISSMAPHEANLLQGEVSVLPDGQFYLFCSTLPLYAMRDALAREPRHYYGAAARLVLTSALNGRSYDWLEYLLEAYPDHVVEFSAFDRNWGTVPGYNTCFWEVRAY